MNNRRCLRIAERLQSQFQSELGIALDPQRMLMQPDYVDDVLTVCDAYPGTALEALAQHFRVALAEVVDDPAYGSLGDTRPGADSTGFGNSKTSQQPHSGLEQERQAARAARRSPNWMQPGRWLGHDT